MLAGMSRLIINHLKGDKKMGEFAEMIYEGYVNAERVNRYLKAHPEDIGRNPYDILEQLNNARKEKKKVDNWLIKRIKKLTA
jgi:hypothetical protein